ncbi:MAG: sulfurtransferase TusA family protein [Planctomycetia bacterium]|nr:sulfurtransferase TusA family protein [Planctomycetia bacterium]
MSSDHAESTCQPHAVQTWDAGDLACGELVLELRMRMQRLAPGTMMCLITRDPGAILDIPAWCRITGHLLRSASPPNFLLERRPESLDSIESS